MFKFGLLLLFAFALAVFSADRLAIDPNVEFAQCCKDKNVPDACIKYCTYDTPNALNLFRFKPKSSNDDEECKKYDVLAPLVQCVQKGKDNMQCCIAAEVNSNFDYCLDLCNGINPLSDDDKWENCEDKKDAIKLCGKES